MEATPYIIAHVIISWEVHVHVVVLHNYTCMYSLGVVVLHTGHTNLPQKGEINIIDYPGNTTVK